MNHTPLTKGSAKNYLVITIIVLLQMSQGLHYVSGASNDKNDWPGWRGQKMNGSADGEALFEKEKNYRLQVSWQKALGSGYSSVSIAGGVAVTMFSDGINDFLVALNAEDGEEFWRFRIDSTYMGHFGSQNGPISTPLIADDKVFALGPRGHLFTLDLKTGQEVWSSHIVDNYQAAAPFYGFTTSPALYKNTLVIETGGVEQNTITAFNKNTGELLWKAGNDRVSYQSPVITTLDDQPYLFCVGGKYIYGLEPESGNLLWQYGHGGSGGAFGSASMNPVILPDNKIFLTYKSSESVLLQLQTDADTLSAQEVWRTKAIKKSYTVPLYHDGYIYGYSGAFLNCVNAVTGKVVWKSRQPGDGFLIVVDGHLVLTTKKGTMNIAKATPTGYSELAGLELFEQLCWTPPSFANGKIYARSHGGIACVEVVPAERITLMEIEEQGVMPGSEFAKFIERVSAAENKTEMIDEFMATQKQMPLVDEEGMVHFVFRGEVDEVALVGDVSGMDMELSMNRVEDSDLYYYSMPLEANAQLNYALLKNEEERVVDPLNPNKVNALWFGESSLVTMPQWVKPQHLKEQDEIMAGRIDSVLFKSAISDSSRTLEVYLPSGYDGSKGSYPVAYVHGTIGSSKIPTTLNNLMGKQIQTAIVVFIPPFIQRGYREYLGINKDTYARIFAEEIVPFIDDTYRTKPTAKSRANLGAFYGGFMAFYTTFKNPEMFGKLGMQTPYWDPDEEKKHGTLISGSSIQMLDIYLDWGKYDLRNALEGWDMGKYVQSFAHILREKGFDFQGGEVNEGFGGTSWSNRTDKVFETLFPIGNGVKASAGKSN